VARINLVTDVKDAGAEFFRLSGGSGGKDCLGFEDHTREQEGEEGCGGPLRVFGGHGDQSFRRLGGQAPKSVRPVALRPRLSPGLPLSFEWSAGRGRISRLVAGARKRNGPGLRQARRGEEKLEVNSVFGGPAVITLRL
jgi:hypothetical protein